MCVPYSASNARLAFVPIPDTPTDEPCVSCRLLACFRQTQVNHLEGGQLEMTGGKTPLFFIVAVQSKPRRIRSLCSP